MDEVVEEACEVTEGKICFVRCIVKLDFLR